MTDRVAFFIDAQNLYNGARDSFGARGPDGAIHEPSVFGQIRPMDLGDLICNRPPTGFTRKVTEVRIYTGCPESTKDPKGYGANLAQCAAWEKTGAVVIHRTLRYPRDWPNAKPEEKGIDVGAGNRCSEARN